MTTPSKKAASTRPSTARKVTRKTEERRRAPLEEGVRFTIDDESYVLRLGDVTPKIARRFRATLGFSFNTGWQLLQQDTDIDLIAAMVWVARLVAGEDIGIDDVDLSYAHVGDEGRFDMGGVDEEDDSPEA